MVAPGGSGRGPSTNSADTQGSKDAGRAVAALRQLCEVDSRVGRTGILKASADILRRISTGGHFVLYENRASDPGREIRLRRIFGEEFVESDASTDEEIILPEPGELSESLRSGNRVVISRSAGMPSEFLALFEETGIIFPVHRRGAIFGILVHSGQPDSMVPLGALVSQDGVGDSGFRGLLEVLLAECALQCDLSLALSSLSMPAELVNQLENPLVIVDLEDRSVVGANRAARKRGIDSDLAATEVVRIALSLLGREGETASLCLIESRYRTAEDSFSVMGALLSDARQGRRYVLLVMNPESEASAETGAIASAIDEQSVIARQLLLERQSRQIISKVYSSLESDAVLQTLVDSLGMALGCERCIVAKMVDQAPPVVSYEFAVADISPLGLGRMTNFPRNIYALLQSGVTSFHDVASLRQTSGVQLQDVNSLLQNGISSLMGAPLVYKGSVFGVVVCIESDRIREWEPAEVDLLRLSAHHAAVALTHCKQHQDIKDQLFNADVFRNLSEQLNKSLQLASTIRQPARKKEERPQSVNLSSRELEVLRLIASGLANKEIANKLFLTESTVELHASRIRKKLKLKSRTALVKYACDHDLV